jgi:hypothetical protein
MSQLLWLLLTLPAAGADGRVEQILTARDVLMSAASNEDCTPGQIFVIYSQSDRRALEEKRAEPIGFADIYERFGDKKCLAKVKSHSQSALIREKDPAIAINMKSGEREIPGRNDLIREGHKEHASFYKATVYGGYFFGQTASTLDRGEFLVGVSPIMYGIRNNVQVDLTYLLLFTQVVQTGVKYRFLSNEDMRLAVYLQNARFWDLGKDAWVGEIHYDSISNGRTVTHTKLRYSSKVPRDLLLSDKAKEKDSTLELSTVTEWVLNSWNRMLLGPKFVAGNDFDLGFLFSFLYIERSFHAAVNLNVNSMRKLDFKTGKQTVGLDLFWRF